MGDSFTGEIEVLDSRKDWAVADRMSPYQYSNSKGAELK